MEITKLSTKGQVVIPEQIRKDINIGTPFIIIKQNDLIILKQVKGLKQEELEEIKELDKIWKEIDSGQCETYSEEEFFAKFKAW